MFVKLVIVACCVAATYAAWHGPLAGGKPADQYPAGVSPHACPNYPHCDNPALAANPSAPIHGGWNGGHAGAWNGGHGGAWNGGHGGAWNGAYNGAHGNGQWNGAHDGGQWNGDNGAYGHHGAYNQNALHSGEYTGDGDYHGEGLAESGAYGPAHHESGAYAGASGYGGAYGHHGHAAQLPAGVDAHSCPNYPFCH